MEPEIVKWLFTQGNFEIKKYLQFLEKSYPKDLPAAIAEGIKCRTALLDEVLGSLTDGLSASKHIRVLQDKIMFQSATTAPTTLPVHSKSSTNPGVLALHFSTSPLTIIPLAVGFSKSITVSPGIGTYTDASFWWLVASTLLALQANLLTFTQMLLDGLSYTPLKAWIFLGGSVGSGIVSVCIYCCTNTARGSTLSFLAAYFAIGTMIIDTSGKIKRRKDSSTLGEYSKTVSNVKIRTT